MSTENNNGNNENANILRSAMELDEKIDELKSQLNKLLQERSNALSTLTQRGIKRFAWKGDALTIARKSGGLFFVRGKRKEINDDIFSID